MFVLKEMNMFGTSRVLKYAASAENLFLDFDELDLEETVKCFSCNKYR